MAVIRPNTQSFKAQGKGKGKGKFSKPSFGGGKGGKHGGGKGGKAQAGTWMFVPAAAPVMPRWGAKPMKGFGKGARNMPSVYAAPAKGFGKAFGGKGAKGGKGGKGGKGKVMDKEAEKRSKMLDKLGKIDADRKVWIGGLSEDTKRGALHAHFKEIGKVHEFVIMKKGTACIAFKEADEASSAIAALNGSDLDGNTIEVDVWTQKEKTERQPREKKEKKPKTAVINTKFAKTALGKKGKGKGVSPMDEKIREKLKEVDHACKIWVGGVDCSQTSWKQLKQHFKDNGCEVELVDLRPKGTACMTFKTDDEASTAVAAMNGTDLGGKTLQVDAWTKPERKGKKADAA